MKHPWQLGSRLVCGSVVAASGFEDIDLPTRQHCLFLAIDQHQYKSLLETAPNVRFKAIALSSTLHYAGDWLNVVPSNALGLYLLDQEFHPCLQYWLGHRMVEGGIKCPACQIPADFFEDH